MEITLTNSALQKALQLVGRISAKHVSLPVLQCVRIEASAEQITLQATNLELAIEIPLEGTVAEPGVVAVPAQTFLQSIQFISENILTLRAEEQVLQLETKTSNTSIKLFSAEEFPVLAKVTGDMVSLQGAMFSIGIKSVAFAASQTSIKPELGSVFLQQKKEQTVTFVATDSFRLMERTVSQRGVSLVGSCMIPNKNALELARVCDLVGDDPQFCMNENQCALWFKDGTYISSRLVTGTFPDYEKIIPKEFVTTATVLKSDIQQTIKKTATFLNKFRQITLVIADNAITATSKNSDVGHTTHTIPAQIEGEELSLNFNQQYIADPLQYISSDSLQMRCAGVGRPMVITPINDASLRYLVMPMNK